MLNCRYFGREQGPGKKSQVNESQITFLHFLVATKVSSGRDLDSSGSFSAFTGCDQNKDLVTTREDNHEAAYFWLGQTDFKR